MYVLLSLKNTEQKLPVFLLLFELYKITNEKFPSIHLISPSKLTIINNLGSAISDFFFSKSQNTKIPLPPLPLLLLPSPSILLPPPPSSGVFTVECLDFIQSRVLTHLPL